MIDSPNLFIISVLVFFSIVVSLSDVYAYENLYVSRDIAEKNIEEKYTSISNSYILTDECSSFAPKNYDHKSNYRYIDQLSPTFDVGFLKNEFPLVINSISFEKSDFVTKSKTIPLEIGEYVSVNLLLFENRGSQNIQNVTMYVDTQNLFLTDENFSSISIVKDEPESISDPIQYYIKGQIEEDFGQSYRTGSPWAVIPLK